MLRILFFVFALALNSSAIAGQWIIGSSSGIPGAPVPISVSLTGDGQTRDGELTIIFDESRVALPVASGVIPGAGQNGATCLRTASNKVFIARLGGTLLPSTATILCNLPFTVSNPAPKGSATLTGTKAGCYTDVSTSASCTVTNGAIVVSGTVAPPITVTDPNFKYLFVLLSNARGAPTVAQISTFDFSSAQPRPLTGLNVGAPLFASGIFPQRATGDFAAYLAQYPNTALAKLERYILIQYATSTDLSAAKSSLAADPYVVAVYEASTVEPLSEQSVVIKSSPQAPKSLFNQYHLGVLKMPEAWSYAGGWGLIGIADNGLYTEHVNLKSFSGPGSVGGTFIPGGNFLPKYSIDVGNFPSSVDFNVDELEPVIATGPTPEDAEVCDRADGNDDGMMSPFGAGHGTNVSGIAVANQNSANGIQGVCKNCGLGMMKITSTVCINPTGDAFVAVLYGPESIAGAIRLLSQAGAQSISLSFNITTFPAAPIIDYCGTEINHVICLALQFAKENEVVIASASGNNRSRLNFPARAKGVTGVGGIDPTLEPWDESPGSTTNCPTGSDSECGTNFTKFLTEKRQEIVAPAKAVRASMYPGINWNLELGCGDSVGDEEPGDGVGLCTGTSMSAPQVNAIFGLLRSINPLLPAGDPESAAFGVRDVLTTTSDRAQALLPWDAKLGYGIPDVPAAARKILGTVRGSTVKNRATPLFALYGPTTTDYAVMATPQNAMTLIRYAAAAYATVPTSGNFIGGTSIPGYTEFPHEVTTPSPIPQARAYVLTTEFAPVIDQSRDVMPLYLLDRERNWPLNCNPITSPPGGCNTLNRDFILLTSISEMNSAVAAGYAYRGLQGYVFTTQATGTQALYLKCKTSDDDCAIFLEKDRIAFEFAGYTSTFPSASSPVIGYAYSTGDSDSDGLVDAMEYAVGTNPFSADSDGDGPSDSVEMPMNGVSNSDPCDGPNITCLAPAPLIFANGFE